MDFTMTADPQLLVESVTSLVRDRARVPALTDFVALGDESCVDHALVAERLGHACAPGPWFVASALALPLLRSAGHELADAVAAGERVATVAWAGADGVWRRDPDAGSVRTFVLDLDLAADVVVVLPGGAIGIVEAGDGRQTTWLDLTRTAWEIDVQPSPAGTADLGAVLDRATVVLAAELCGTSRRMLELSVEHARERVQFDQPIGAFQAVQHLLADLALDVERAWAAVQWAAMCVDDPVAAGADAARAPHVAKAAASEAAMHACRTSIQVHGGVGYTWEHDLHQWLRRAATTAHLLGTAEEHHDALASLVLEGATRG